MREEEVVESSRVVLGIEMKKDERKKDGKVWSSGRKFARPIYKKINRSREAEVMGGRRRRERA